MRFPRIPALSPSGGLPIRHNQSTLGRMRLLAEFQGQSVGRMTFRHKNQFFPDEKRVGKDFIQCNFD